MAARRGEERIDNTKDSVRRGGLQRDACAAQLWQVQKGWEEPVRQYGQTVGPIGGRVRHETRPARRGSRNKLNSIIIPKIEFRDASIREAIDFLRQQAAANDPSAEAQEEASTSCCADHSLGRADSAGSGSPRPRRSRGAAPADGSRRVEPSRGPRLPQSPRLRFRRPTRGSQSRSTRFR